LNLTDSPVGSPQSPMSFSPRSKISELDMEIEMSHKQDTPRAASLPTTEGDAETSTKDWPFDSGEYAKQKQARVAQWKQQLHVLETRKRELECDSIPMILRSTSGSTLLQSRRQKLLETARQTTKTAIADSIAHFQEVRARTSRPPLKYWADLDGRKQPQLTGVLICAIENFLARGYR
jgi:hypothetical protein